MFSGVVRPHDTRLASITNPQRNLLPQRLLARRIRVGHERASSIPTRFADGRHKHERGAFRDGRGAGTM
ncbi:hypothetical protein AKJ09_06662 [Labilithrix luteola]|uniref:Uncharacterized protein n=1 Tax=Labilithrix luteola TaxID=1391654 RepID=A0A0K1Q2K7_9BACT|nr:hypothetical protein AKJ09_06662 [Labilithrix luteola]